MLRFLQFNRRRTPASRRTSFWLNVRRIVPPAIFSGIVTVIWYFAYRNHWSLHPESHLMLGTAIVVFAAIYAIPAGMIWTRIWERSREISTFVLAGEKDGFLLVRDERIPISMHLALAAPALGMLLLLALAPYPSVATGAIVVFMSWFTILLYFVVLLELQRPASGIWFQDRIPSEWLEIDIDAHFKVWERKR